MFFLFAQVVGSLVIIFIYPEPEHIVLDDVLALFLTNDKFPIGGVERIKGFRLINCINMRVEADEIGVWGYAVNPQIWILLLDATDDICCYQSVSWST